MEEDCIGSEVSQPTAVFGENEELKYRRRMKEE